MTHEPFVIERTYAAPIAEVWTAITDKAQLKEWFFEMPDFKPIPGSEFQFSAKNAGVTYVHLCKVTEVVAGKKLKYSWQYPDNDGLSFVTIELFPEGKATRLKLTHEGLETFPQDNPHFRKESYASGWTHFIGGTLKIFVEKSTVAA